MAKNLMPAWQKIAGEIQKNQHPTQPETELLMRMAKVMQEHSQNAASMTRRVSPRCGVIFGPMRLEFRLEFRFVIA